MVKMDRKTEANWDIVLDNLDRENLEIIKKKISYLISIKFEDES